MCHRKKNIPVVNPKNWDKSDGSTHSEFCGQYKLFKQIITAPTVLDKEMDHNKRKSAVMVQGGI